MHHLRHRGHEVILFHVLDEAEVHFPFDGLIEFADVETTDKLTIDAKGMRGDYMQALESFRTTYREECAKANIDYVAMDTSDQLRQGSSSWGIWCSGSGGSRGTLQTKLPRAPVLW